MTNTVICCEYWVNIVELSSGKFHIIDRVLEQHSPYNIHDWTNIVVIFDQYCNIWWMLGQYCWTIFRKVSHCWSSIGTTFALQYCKVVKSVQNEYWSNTWNNIVPILKQRLAQYWNMVNCYLGYWSPFQIRQNKL